MARLCRFCVFTIHVCLCQITINQVEESEVNFVELVHSLLEDPAERKHFFQEVFPVHFGSKYDAALEMLVWEFLSRLEELLPVPHFTQMAALLGEAPEFLDECLQTIFPPDDMKAVLKHHKSLGHFEEKDARLLPMDDLILSSLSLPSGTKPIPNVASCSPVMEGKLLPEHTGHPDAPTNRPSQDNGSRKTSETTGQRLREIRDSGSWQLQVRGGNGGVSQERNSISARPCDETIDLTTTVETDITDSATDENSEHVTVGRVLRKRKLSGGLDIPSKQPLEVSSLLSDENSSESPLISIWGDYTESQNTSFPVTTDTRGPWSEEETLNLLDIWGKDSVQQALKGCLKNRHIFTQISQKLAERGYMRTVEQCQTRIKNLKKCFRQNKGNTRLEWKFYDQLERILGSSASSAVPEVTYDIEELNDEDESRDSSDESQFLGEINPVEIVTRSVPWTDMETLALINTWAEEKLQQQRRGPHRIGNVFPTVSMKMAAQGFSRTPEQCQTKLKRLKTNFRQCYENSLRGHGQTECKFYNELARILVKGPPSMVDLDDMPEDFSANLHQDAEAAVSLLEDRKKVSWSDKETIILLEHWGDPQVQQNLRNGSHNGHVFSEISEKLAASGYSRSPDQCYTRIKRLKTIYRQCRDSSSLSGNDRVEFKFYDLLEQILEKQPSTSSAAVMDSIEISEDSNDESVTETDGEFSTSMEKPPPNFWSDEETLALIDIWGKRDVQRALRGFVHNGHVYTDISERMCDLGYSKSPEQCRSKVRLLKKNFRRLHNRKKRGKKVEYRFYNQLEEILGQTSSYVDDERDEHADEKEEQADQDTGTVVFTPWTEQETVALIEVWAADDIQHSLKTCIRNSHIFADIAEKLSTAGYRRTAEQCHTRIQGLKKTYRRFCNNQRSGGRPAAFRYFHLLAPVLSDLSLYADVENFSTDSSLQPLMDNDIDMYEQASTSSLQADLSRKMPWSDHETRVLLEIWGEDDVQLTLKGCLRNRHVFQYIAEKMSAHGFSRTSEQCYTRIKRLKFGFLHEKEDFRFFREMEGIFRKGLAVAGSVADAFVADEMSDSSMMPVQHQGNHWAADNSKVTWSDGETKLLLDIWGSEEIQENLKSCAKNKHIFSQISEAMVNQGFLRTPEQCQTRIKRLRTNFRHFLEGRKGEKQECKFFDQLLHIFGSKYINPDTLAEESTDDVELVSCSSP
ncbi:uncharacterized protein zgc:113263 [Thalassophryne amazonica]|uniref:uncharacterized protein zgc:113263 n=1 Tax=Thalassophryne amazonica TaxID=390379 RepID=UPI0014717D48|nr:uncharacterized protein zgc:113263 [Thalassophryne amazonica]